MSRAVSTSQWTEPLGSGAAAPARLGAVVLDPDGSYSFAASGPADAYLVAAADGAHFIDPAAASGAPLRVFGNVLLLI